MPRTKNKPLGHHILNVRLSFRHVNAAGFYTRPNLSKLEPAPFINTLSQLIQKITFEIESL